MEFVNLLDKKYSGKGAVNCPNEGKIVKLPQSGIAHQFHGKMAVHGSGAYLVCGVCGAQQPVGRLE